MLIPKYTITNSILKSVASIDVGREIIEDLPLSSTWISKFRNDALEETIFGSILLEGGSLTEDSFRDYLQGRESDIPEVELNLINNLKSTMEFIFEGTKDFSSMPSYYLTLETILNLQKILSGGEGGYRVRQLAIRNSKTLEVTYSPPPAAEVPYLIEDLVNWINTEGKDVHPAVKSGIVHFEIYRIHPFVEFNNLVAHFLSLLLLYLDGYSLSSCLSFIEYFSSDLNGYYSTLHSVAKQAVLDTHERDLTPWLEYYCKGLAQKVASLKEKIKRISKESHPKDKLGEKVELTQRQMIIMGYLHKHGSFQNKDFRKMFPDHSDDTVLREIKFLKQKGLVRKQGNTKRATYVLS